MHRSPAAVAAAVFCTAAIVVAAIFPRGLIAQDPATGTIVGMVFDSTSSAPLAGARVAVVGTGAAVESDDAGQFRLDEVPAGRQTVVFFHGRLGDLGVSPAPAQVVVAGAAVAEVLLAVPSRATILGGWCSIEPGEGATSIGGVVTDSITGVPLPRARVAVLGPPSGVLLRRRVLREVRTENSGEFRLCNLVSADDMALRVTFGSSRAEPAAVIRPGAQVVDVAMHIADPVSIAGSVRDYATGGPVAGAHVELVGTPHSEFTDSAGKFGFVNVAPGKQLISTTFLGYAPRIDSLTVFSNEALGLEIELSTEAIALDPIVVTGRRRERVFTTPGTRFSGLTSAQVDSIAQRVADLPSLLRAAQMPGLTVTEQMLPNAFGDPQWGVCIEMQRSRGAMPNTCNMVEVRINDGPVPSPSFFLQEFSPQDVRSIQFITPIEAGLLYGDRGGQRGASHLHSLAAFVKS